MAAAQKGKVNTYVSTSSRQTASPSVSTETHNVDHTTKAKASKPKRETRADRLARRDARVLQQMYAPKDSHLTLISPALMKQFNQSPPSSSKIHPGSSMNLSASKQRQNLAKFSQASATAELGSGLDVSEAFPLLSPGDMIVSVAADNSLLPESRSNPQTPIRCQNTDDSLYACHVPFVLTPEHESTLKLSEVRKAKKSKNMQPSKKPIILSLEEALRNTPSSALQKKTKIRKRGKIDPWTEVIKGKWTPAGNKLDASGPVLLHRGKMRERPKKKRLSKLKKVILVSRSLRQANRVKLSGSDEEAQIIPAHAQSLEMKVRNETTTPGQPDEMVIKCEPNLEIFEQSKLQNGLGVCKIKKSSCTLKTASSQEQICDNNSKIGLDKEEIRVAATQLVDGTEITANKTEVASPMVKSESVQEKVEESGRDYGKLFRKLLDEALVGTTIKEEEPKLNSTLVLEQGQFKEEETQIQFSPEAVAKAKTVLHRSGKKWRPYCDMYVTKELQGHVIAFLQELHRFQDRLYHSDPVKFQNQNNRRYVHGLKEVSIALERGKIQMLIIAPDIEPVKGREGLDEKLENVLASAKRQGIPHLFSGSRYILGFPILIKRPISIIGILNKQGAEELFEKLMGKVKTLRDQYTTDLHKSIEEVMKSEIP